MKWTTDRRVTVLVILLTYSSSVLCKWNMWSDFTQCSRTCGGGVRHKDRMCVADRLDRPVCKGKKRIYKLCNTQDCDGESQDFRAQQCQKYNGVFLDGVRYKWRPYYGHGETCELLCFADGFPFFHKLADKVVDGTPCLEYTNRLCVNGQCKTIGCDFKIGSLKKFDVCGICDGYNSTCTRSGDINEIFNVPHLSPGHTTIVEIPAGAKDIYIRERGVNKNTIVFWDSSGKNFAIDKETRELLRSVELAGTQFIYLAEDTYNTYGRVQSPGPTNREITVYAVNEGAYNPEIRYGYTLPKRNNSHSAVPLHLIEQGSQFRPKYNGKDRRIMEPEVLNKKAVLKPSRIRVSTSHMPSRKNGRTDVRVANKRRPDTKRYNGNTDGNERSQQYVYQNAIQIVSGNRSITDNVYRKQEPETTEKTARESEHFDHYIPNEIRYQPNSEYGRGVELESRGSGTSTRVYGDQRYMWSHGQWTNCSSSCGSGFQRRVVSCVDRERRESADADYCSLDLRPSSVRRCNNGDCRTNGPSSYVRWQVGDWGQCSRSCDLGDQVQHVFCEAVFHDNTTISVDDEQCLNQYHAKPQYRRSCNDGVPCQSWIFSKWSTCSVTCGGGVQQRSVNCRSKVTKYQIVSADLCNADSKPVAVKRCDMGACPLPRQSERPDRRWDCRNTFYGCCPDGITTARGPNKQDCFQAPISQEVVHVGGRQVLLCTQIKGEDRQKRYAIEWTKQGLQGPVYKQYRWKVLSGSSSIPVPKVDRSYEGRVRIVDDASLEISNAREADSGLYTCRLIVQQSRLNSRIFGRRIFLDVRGKCPLVVLVFNSLSSIFYNSLQDSII